MYFVIHDLLFMGEINKGDILGPLLNEDGSYLVLKIIGWKDEVSITGKESKHRWNDISEMMKDKIAKKKYLTSVQKLMAGKKIDFNQLTFPIFLSISGVCHSSNSGIFCNTCSINFLYIFSVIPSVNEYLGIIFFT